MSTVCKRVHTILSEGKLVPDQKGGMKFEPGGFPDLFFGYGETKNDAEKKARKQADSAANEFCATKNCPRGRDCVVNKVDREFDVVMKYETEGMGWVAILRIKAIECTCEH